MATKRKSGGAAAKKYATVQELEAVRNDLENTKRRVGLIESKLDVMLDETVRGNKMIEEDRVERRKHHNQLVSMLTEDLSHHARPTPPEPGRGG